MATYDDYKPLIERVMAGETQLLLWEEPLGWAITRFNRKLDNVCDKLDKQGVAGLRGGPGKLASNRRTRLVEYAVGTRLVTPEDLALLDLPDPEAGA